MFIVSSFIVSGGITFFLCFILYEITLTGDRFTPLMGPITHPRQSKILHAVIFDVNVSETSFNTTSL